MTTKCILTVCGLILVIAIYFPTRHARHYNFVETENILCELWVEKTLKLNSNLKNCTYQDVILNSQINQVENISEIRDFHEVLTGGEYIPKNCTPLYKSAIILPYRNRKEQLDTFLNYMHAFLQRQGLHYRIFVVEQNDNRPFNRAKMLNYGAKVAIGMNFSCLILHDVDLIPLDSGNIYACGRKPRHMSSSLDIFRYNLPYLSLFGGAVAILSEQFAKANGMSNIYYGWGGEDDDFFKRLLAQNILPYRFSPDISKYTMLYHKKEKPSMDRYTHLQSSLERQETDGLNSLGEDYTVKHEKLYTHILAT